HGAPRDFKTTDSGCFELRVVIDFDAVDPFQDQHAARDIAFDDSGNDDARSVLEDLAKSCGIGRFADVVDLFEDGAFELAIKRREVDELTRIHEARNDPDDEPDRAQVHVDQAVNLRSLDFDCHDL